MFNVLLSSLLMAGPSNAQVTATGTMGVTNPPQATAGTPINQTSDARLLTVNSIDDFCIFAPPEPNSVIGNTEQIEVAWCVQPRNNARVIPDGVLQAVHFVKTPLYVQVQGWGDFSKINIAEDDMGGELDPHGATGDGNPIGGNVTSNITGEDVHYEEWMNYMAVNQFCIRVCTAENSTYSAALECQHTLDEMGCQWVMPGDYTNNSFTSCEADAAYPPGIYPQSNGSTSTFAQRYTGTYTGDGGSIGTFTVGQTVTPQTPFSTPASSMCTTFSSVGNGIALESLGVSGTIATVSGASGSNMASASATGSSASGSSRQSGSGSGSGARESGSASGSAGAGGASTSSAPNAAFKPVAAFGSAGAVGLVTLGALLFGAGAVMI